MNNIKTARVNANLSQKEIAITLGVSIPTVSDWESGKKFPSGKNLIKLAQVLHTTTDFLLGCEDTKKEPTSVAESGLPMMIRIKNLRRMSGETQESIAALIGITRGAYANIENGKREPDIKTMTILANHFDVTIGYLLGRTDEKEKPTPVSEDGLDDQDRQLMELMKLLTADQKEFLRAQLLTLTGRDK